MIGITPQNKKLDKLTDILTFGKHKGKSVKHILLHNPSYILWLHDNDVLEIAEDIVIEAEEQQEEIDYYYSESHPGEEHRTWGDL